MNDNTPAFTSSASFTADENQTAIGTVTATDADGDTLTYSISGSDIAIDSSSGVLTFAAAPDYETKSSYAATVTITDGTRSDTQDITVTIANVNEGQSFTSSASFTAAENQTAIGTVSATDADGDSLSYSISGSEISIGAFNGVLTFTAAPDYETKSSYSATVTVSDGSLSTTQEIAVSISDINEKPIITSASSYSVDENQTTIGSITATDESSDLIYELSGTDASSININNLTGAMTFKSAPDYETKQDYSIIANVSDDSFTTRKAIQILINNLNDNSPVITSSSSFTVNEGVTSVGTVTATDADGDTLEYLIYKPFPSGSGFGACEIAIDSETGALAFISAPDYETQSSYSCRVLVSDGTNQASQDITVSITNTNDNIPVITSNASFTAAENQTAIGTVTATDGDGETLVYSISGSEIAIDSSSGLLTFISAPDYETKSSYSATVTVTDGITAVTQDITVSIINLNDNTPSIISGASFTVDEGETAIGTLTATDADDDTLTFSISGSDIAIDSSSGALTFVSAPDYETKSSYSATVTVTDGTNSVTQDITVSINNLNDNTPAFSSNASFTADENQTAIGTVTATDADSDTLTFSVSGSDINIDSSSGVLTFALCPRL